MIPIEHTPTKTTDAEKAPPQILDVVKRDENEKAASIPDTLSKGEHVTIGMVRDIVAAHEKNQCPVPVLGMKYIMSSIQDKLTKQQLKEWTEGGNILKTDSRLGRVHG